MTVTSPDPVCPRCHSTVDTDPEAEALRCSGCGAVFPHVHGRLPILVADPPKYLEGQRMLCEYYSTELESSAGLYAQLSAEGGPRAEVHSGISAALDANRRLVGRIAALLPSSEATLERYEPPPGMDLFPSLRRDWSGCPEAEAEVQVTVDAVHGALPPDPSGATLLLGAGAGRVFAELSALRPGLIGIDSSFAMAASWLLLSEEGELAASYPLTGNFRRAADEAEIFTARRDRAPGDASYIVADAADLPFLPGTFDAVVSPYFTDLLPFSRLLPEVGRVLAPGGAFVHFGPLGWAFPDPGEYWALDEVPAAMAGHGLVVERQEFVRNTLFADARRLNRVEFDNLLLAARRAE